MNDSEKQPRAKKPLSKRSRARMLAMQGLYQFLMTGYDYARIESQLREEPGFNRADQALFSRLLEGVLDERESLEAALTPCLDRPIVEVSPIERSILTVAAFELRHIIEVPYRVVINEAIEMAKRFGGVDGHKYINGVLDRLAVTTRPVEIAAIRDRSASS